MEDIKKLEKLKLFLNVYGVISLILFGGLFLLTAINAPIMQDGGALRLMRWDMPSPHIELMIEAVYFVWGVFMLLAARKPVAYISFLSFTLWANLVHGLVMVPESLMTDGYAYKMLTDVAYCLFLALGLWLLMPKSEETQKI